ncbi:hypothetical protein FA95DRAFT_1557865 [Auriscalpium vulgare]|uniref:Uncharacterized protein n=1 Tax=Auriscalpium vulgare TaxID=40419 RepID=A0ACB8RWL4_9AGAM|nr:hypothetical protein FA95DRAFT_1557865 [Auriscalpium vulgare]
MLPKHAQSELQQFVNVVTLRLYEAAIYFDHGVVEGKYAVRLQEEIDLAAYAIGVAALHHMPLVVPQVIRLCVPELEAGTLRWEMIRVVPYPTGIDLPEDDMGLTAWWSDGIRSTAAAEAAAHLEHDLQSSPAGPAASKWDVLAKLRQESKASDGLFADGAGFARRIALEKRSTAAALSELLDKMYTT